MTTLQTCIDFPPAKRSNYSFETSLPAYQSNREERQKTKELMFQKILCGHNTLKHLEEATGEYPNIVSARVNDLIKEHRVKYEGFTHYKGMKRKQIVVI
jgi:hypothetical protein